MLVAHRLGATQIHSGARCTVKREDVFGAPVKSAWASQRSGEIVCSSEQSLSHGLVALRVFLGKGGNQGSLLLRLIP